MLMRGTKAGSLLRLGAAETPLAEWSVLPLPRGPAFTVAVAEPWMVVSTPKLGQVTFEGVDADDDAATLGESLTIPTVGDQPLDAIAKPRPTVLTRAGEGEPSCESQKGGVTFRRQGQPARHFSAPLAASRGWLRELDRGDTLALWLVPHRCAARDHTLYGVVIDAAGQPVAPVAIVAEADEVALASEGSQVDLWLRDDRTIVHVPLFCQ